MNGLASSLTECCPEKEYLVRTNRFQELPDWQSATNLGVKTRSENLLPEEYFPSYAVNSLACYLQVHGVNLLYRYECRFEFWQTAQHSLQKNCTFPWKEIPMLLKNITMRSTVVKPQARFPSSLAEVVITTRKHLPECSKSKASLICSSFMVWVTYSSTLNLPSRYLSTSFGTSSLDLKPPKAVPLHTRPTAVIFSMLSFLLKILVKLDTLLNSLIRPLCYCSTLSFACLVSCQTIHEQTRKE